MRKKHEKIMLETLTEILKAVRFLLEKLEKEEQPTPSWAVSDEEYVWEPEDNEVYKRYMSWWLRKITKKGGAE